MANMKRKLGTILGALALMAGAVPGTIGTAAAIETGQLLIKDKPIARPLIIIMTVVAVVALAVLISRKGSDTPTSP